MDYSCYLPHPIVPSDDWHTTLYPHQNLVYPNLPWFIYDNRTWSHPISFDISPTSTTPPWDWGTTPPFTPITCEPVPSYSNSALPHVPIQSIQLTPQPESKVIHQSSGSSRTGSRSHYMNRTTFEPYLNDLDFTTITPPQLTSNLPPSSHPNPIFNPKPKPTPLSLPTSLPPPVHHICPLPSCRRAFKRPEHLKRHIHSLHDKIRPYTCPTCHRTFSRSDNLIQHRKIHSRPPPPTEGI